jgi:hypothetical protein
MNERLKAIENVADKRHGRICRDKGMSAADSAVIAWLESLKAKNPRNPELIKFCDALIKGYS